MNLIVCAVAVTVVLGSGGMGSELSDMERLLDQGTEAALAGASTGQVVMEKESAFRTKSQLIERYVTAEEPLWQAFAPRVRSALTSPTSSLRVRAAQTLASRPAPEDLPMLLAVLRVESDPSARDALARCLVRAVSRVPESGTEQVIDEAIVFLDESIRSPSTRRESLDLLVGMLGQMGPRALPRVQGLAKDERWSSRLHWSLPAALAATGDPSAGADLIALYGANPGLGFRANCLAALGTLVHRASPRSLERFAPTVEFLRKVAFSEPDRNLAAAACAAFCLWHGASAEPETAGLIVSRMGSASESERSDLLQAAFVLRLRPDAATRELLEAVSNSGGIPAGQRKLARAILDNACEVDR
jgi:HEAT repeat protein